MQTTRRVLLRAAGASLLAGVAGCAGGDGGGDGGDDDGGGSTATPTEASTTVRMVNSQFDPRTASVRAGETVIWTNEDNSPHTVTSASDNWEKDAEVPGGEETTHAFDEDGVYDVYCRFHGSADLSGMSMKIAVGEASIQNPPGSDGDDGGGSDGDDGGGGGLY